MKQILALLFSLSLAACGGGSGGGTNSTGGQPASQTGLTVSFDTSSLSFDFIEGQTPPSKIINANAIGSTTSSVLIGAEVTGNGIATPISVVASNASRTAIITVTPTRSLPAGTYNGTINMLVCADQGCTVQHGGSPHKVSYVVTVRAALKTSSAALSLAAPENGNSVATPLTLTLPPPGSTVLATVDYAGAQTGWLSAQVNGNTVTVQATPRGMSAGSYRASLKLALADGSQNITLPVSLTVSDGLLVPDGTAVTVNNASTAQQMRGSTVITQANGSGASSWNASSDQTWLKLDTASGTFSTQMAWHIDPSAFAQLPNGIHHTATLTVRSDNGLSPKTFKIDVYKTLAQLNGIDSTALVAGKGGDVMLYGSGFDTLSPLSNFITVSGTTPSSLTRLSDKVLRIHLPPLAEGRYEVGVGTAWGPSASSKTLNVTASATYSYQALDTQGLKTTVIWDSVSKSAFVANRTLNSVMRYASVNGKFQLMTTRSFPFVDSIGMTMDRGALVLQSGNTKIYKLSPKDLSTIALYDLSPSSAGYASNLTVPLTIMGDNRLFMPSFGWVSLDTGAVTAFSYTGSIWNNFGMADWGAMSGNGLRMLWPDSGRYSPSSPTARLDLSDGKFGQTSASFFYSYAASYDGNSWAYNGRVVDFDLNLKGEFAIPSGWNGNQMVFSRNGSRLYFYATGTANGNKSRVYVFDTSRPMDTTINFPVLGYIELDDVPNCPYSSQSDYYSGCYTFNTHITITDDEQTLFIVGDTKFLVVPIPLGLKTSAAAVKAKAMVRMSPAPR